MERNYIEEQANKLTRIYSEPPIPVYEVARLKGLAVYEAEFRENVKGHHGFCDFVDDAIYLNKASSPTQQIFTAAHELGHWILHGPKYKQNNERFAFLPKAGSIAYDTGNREEDEANFFASRLLVPSLLLQPYLSYDNSIAALAKEFKVFRAMMEMRVNGE